jgi:hypothetical protein
VEQPGGTRDPAKGLTEPPNGEPPGPQCLDGEPKRQDGSDASAKLERKPREPEALRRRRNPPEPPPGFGRATEPNGIGCERSSDHSPLVPENGADARSFDPSSNPPRRTPCPNRARHHRLDAVGAGGNASPHRVGGTAPVGRVSLLHEFCAVGLPPSREKRVRFRPHLHPRSGGASAPGVSLSRPAP